MFLSIGNVLKYLNATPDSRNFVEGERLLNASHLILCGIEEKCEANLNIFASCLHTSAISSPPHEISGIIKNSVENGMSVTSMSCTCKAGLGGTCKHIAAATKRYLSALANVTSRHYQNALVSLVPAKAGRQRNAYLRSRIDTKIESCTGVPNSTLAIGIWEIVGDIESRYYVFEVI
ncbi:hypothetical protein NQ317_013921 [Molorchus minor]|uniref:SWIM-type domain-containing protein n=1 Tax=Molorchus minor TaxID=1323400 RepID=A0ABQ9K7N6_9CUCU|nr:hypothetical protein NQ317_013921 [Molorchus minor]